MSVRRHVCVCVVSGDQSFMMNHLWFMSWRQLICVCPDGWPEFFESGLKFKVRVNPIAGVARIEWESKTRSVVESYARRSWLILPHV